MMLRVLISILALLSPLFFPLYFAAIVILGASFLMPPLALVAGMLIDALYYVPGHIFLPYASLLGLAASIASYFVHDFIKARIIAR